MRAYGAAVPELGQRGRLAFDRITVKGVHPLSSLSLRANRSARCAARWRAPLNNPWPARADEEAVAKNVEAFRKAQIAANAEALAALCAPELSYSHSDGHVEDKATFIANATDGKSKVLSLEYQDPKIVVVGPAAIWL